MGVHRLGRRGTGLAALDLGYAARAFVPLDAPGDPVADGRRLRAFADGYGLNEDRRAELRGRVVAHTRAMCDLLQTNREPWARLYAQGHGDYWQRSADYVAAHLDEWAAALRL